MDLEEILTLSKKLISKLKKRKRIKKLYNWNGNQNIGDILLKLVPQFGIYSSFVNRYMNFVRDVEELKNKKIEFESLLNEIKLSTKNQLGIFDLLIAPVQHVPRYILLLNVLIKHTPKTHPDYDNLQNALKEINKKADSINQRKKIFENIKKIFEINNKLKKSGNFVLTENLFRRFIKMDEIIEIRNSKPIKFNLILFNDLILIVKPKIKKLLFKEKEFYFLKKKYYLNKIGNIRNLNFEKNGMNNEITQIEKNREINGNENKRRKGVNNNNNDGDNRNKNNNTNNNNNNDNNNNDNSSSSSNRGDSTDSSSSSRSANKSSENFEYKIKYQNKFQIIDYDNINNSKKENSRNNKYFSFQIWDLHNKKILEEFHFKSQLKRDSWAKTVEKIKLKNKKNILDYHIDGSTDRSRTSHTQSKFSDEEMDNN